MRSLTILFLTAALGTAEAATIASTFGPGDTFVTFGGYQIGGGAVGSGGYLEAAEFTPGVDALLTQIRVAAFVFSNSTGDRDLVVDLSEGAVPSTPIETFAATLSREALGQIYTFNSALHPELVAGQPYWITLSSNDLIDNNLAWDINSVYSHSFIAGRIPGQTLWTFIYNASPAFDVSGQLVEPDAPSVPETSTGWTLGSGLALLIAGTRRLRPIRHPYSPEGCGG